MEKFRRSLYTAIAFVALSAVFSLASPAVGAPDGGRDVVVTNTAASPVPVHLTGPIAGAVTVSGAVSVTNTPTVDARQAGPWTVNLAGDGVVRVGNTSTEPVPVRDVGAIAREPVMIRGSVEARQLRSPVLYTVPAGKRLVVEYVNLSAMLTTDSDGWGPQTAFLASLTTNQQGVGHQYPMRVDPGPVFDNGRGGFDHYLFANTPVTLYFEAGIELGFFKNSPNGSLSGLDVAIAGYLIAAP